MAFDIYSSTTLVRVVESLEGEPISFLRNTFFPFTQQSDDEHIHFDVVDKHRRLAPYVSPLREGKVMEHRGFQTKQFEPAYVKPKAEINPNRQFRRRAGEPIGGNLSPSQRRDIQVRETLREQDEMVEMLEEVQASEALRLGQVTIEGEGYGTVVLAFGRDPDLTVELTTTDRWGEADVNPLADIEAWALRVRQKSGGAIVRNVILGIGAWTLLKESLTEQQLKNLFDSLRGSQSNIELGPRLAEKVKYEGQLGDFHFWSYSDTYADEDGTEVEVMPENDVILAASAVEGTRTYAAIRDPKAGFQPLRTYPKMWYTEDPAMEWIMTQSAPLMVPLRPNASFGAKVR